MDTVEKNIRVLFLNTRDAFGADVAVHAQLARALDRGRVRVWAATSTYAQPGLSARAVFEAIPELTVLPLALGRPVSGQRGAARAQALLYNAEGAASLLRLGVRCRRERVDIVHVTERPRDALFGLALARLAGSACVIHGHTSYYRHDATRLGNWVLHQADAVVGVSRFTAETYARDAGLSPDRVFAVHNAVDTDIFQPDVPEEERVAMRRRLGIAAEVPLIGCVARLNRWKGHDTLLRALLAVRRSVPGAHVIFAGTNADMAPDSAGTYLDYLTRRVEALGLSSAVTFAGFLPQSDMPTFYAALDAVAHPAIEEPFGLAVAEGMACGRPLVAVGEGGVPEIVRDGVDGLLVPREQPDALAQALVRVLSEREFASRLARAGRARVVAAFSPRQQADAMLEIYQRVADRKCGRVSESSLVKEGQQCVPDGPAAFPFVQRAAERVGTTHV
jgi:glycosyltransferase involved in cell wall biosynthesis